MISDMDDESREARMIALAESMDISIELIRHEIDGTTTADAVSALQVDPSILLKALILLDERDNVSAGTIILGSSRLDFAQMRTLTGLRNLRMAKPDEVQRITSFSIGGVPPFAVKDCTLAFVDEKVLEREFVIGAGGHSRCGVRFNPATLRNIHGVVMANISK